MKLMFIGTNISYYMDALIECLNHAGIYCSMTYKGQKCQITLDDIADSPLVIECFCHELQPVSAIKQLNSIEAEFKGVTHIINVFSIKWFAEFRYNVDEDWKDAERWTRPDIYQKMLRSLAGQDTRFIWVFSEAEKILESNYFFLGKENEEYFRLTLSSSEQYYSKDIQDKIMEFLKEIGEDRFVGSMFNDNNSDTVGFAFSSSDADNGMISEGMNDFWMLYTFLAAIKESNIADEIFGQDFFVD